MCIRQMTRLGRTCATSDMLGAFKCIKFIQVFLNGRGFERTRVVCWMRDLSAERMNELYRIVNRRQIHGIQLMELND